MPEYKEKQWKCVKEVVTSALLLLFSHSVVSDSLQPHGLQHTRLPWCFKSESLSSDLNDQIWFLKMNLTILSDLDRGGWEMLLQFLISGTALSSFWVVFNLCVCLSHLSKM